MDEKIKFLQEQINERIQGFNTRKIYNKKKADNYFLMITFLSALSTILLGINIVKYQDLTRIIVLIIGVLVTTISVLNNFYRNDHFWLRYTETLNQLYQLNFELKYLLINKEKITDQDLDTIKEQYNKILNETNTDWKKIRDDGINKINSNDSKK